MRDAHLCKKVGRPSLWAWLCLSPKRSSNQLAEQRAQDPGQATDVSNNNNSDDDYN